MNKSIIRFLLCRVMQFEGLFLLLPCIVACIYKENQGFVFLAVAGVVILLGTLGGIKKPKSKVFYAREGFVTVSLSWLVLSLIGAVPFVLTGEIPNYVDAVFETVSGFTTTGASILTDVEAMSQTCMFWRCFTNWIGGMGVLVFIMSVVPLSGSHNINLMKAESTGPDVGKLVPRIKDTAKILYGIYLGITILAFISYLCTGMKVYDAMIISFSTMGTGGFANLNASLGGYSHGAQIVAIVFMILCGINFNAYYLLIKRKPLEVFRNEEIRIYLLILLVGAGIITFSVHDIYGNWGEAFHQAMFQMASIQTTTGFGTTDFDQWPLIAKGVLLFAMVVGGCAGATAGGIKVSRFMIMLRTMGKEAAHLTHPRSVKKVRLNGTTVSDEVVRSVHSFIIVYILLIIASFLLVALDNFDFTSSFTAVLSMLGNIGPGLGMVGPTGNYSQFSEFSKIVLSFDMLAGRLEIFPMMILFYVGTWRKS